MRWPWQKEKTVKLIDAIPKSGDEVLPPGYEVTLSLPSSKTLDSAPGRHLFVFLDGTWNEERTPIGEGTPTNVLRMFQEIDQRPQKDGHRHVLARYYRGVGNRQDNGAVNRMWFGFNGKDEERIRAAAFAGLYRDYGSSNDVIYIIGFSRGAACARLLARDLCDKGFPPELTVRTRHFSNLLTGQIEPRVEIIEGGGRLEDSIRPRIKFLGCWDTVDAFALPARFPRHNLKEKMVRGFKHILPSRFGQVRIIDSKTPIPPRIEFAVHCVAIDETRDAFLPTLMPFASNVEEVWFPGVHSDVGGGYDDNLLADEAYRFMRQRLLSAAATEKTLASVRFNRPTRKLASAPHCFHFHGLNSGFRSARDKVGFGTSLRRVRVLGGPPGEVPKIHSSLHKVVAGSNIFAANKKNNPTWRVNYDPYNFRTLEKNFKEVQTGDEYEYADSLLEDALK